MHRSGIPAVNILPAIAVLIKVEKAVFIKEELTKNPAQGTNTENTNKK